MRELGWIEERGGEERRRTHGITRHGRAILNAELARLTELLRIARPAMGKP
jgi:hypothetical protein